MRACSLLICQLSDHSSKGGQCWHRCHRYLSVLTNKIQRYYAMPAQHKVVLKKKKKHHHQQQKTSPSSFLCLSEISIFMPSWVSYIFCQGLWVCVELSRAGLPLPKCTGCRLVIYQGLLVSDWESDCIAERKRKKKSFRELQLDLSRKKCGLKSGGDF